MAGNDTRNVTVSSINDTDRSEDWTDVFVRAVDWLCIYYGLFLIVVGCLCNALSFIILSRKSFSSTNMSLHLRVLCISDSGAILGGLLNFFVMKTYGINLREEENRCKVSIFFSHLFLFISSWILIIVTIERVISILVPHRIHNICSRFLVKTVIATTIFLLSVISLMPSLTYGDTLVTDSVQNSTYVFHCRNTVTYHVFSMALAAVYGVVFAFLPSLLLVVLNIIIIVGVTRSRKSVMKAPTNVIESSDDRSGTKAGKLPRRYQPSTKNHITRREASLTKTVLAINITFIICNFPACAYGFSPQYMTKKGMGPTGAALGSLLLMLMYTNNAMNFVLYCVTGTKFRSEVKAFFNDLINYCCKRNGNNASF